MNACRALPRQPAFFCGVDVTREPIPVLPTVHYNMGGIPTNYHDEVLSPTADDQNRVAPGLMAIGEAACVSVHGANRLGSNSLLDIVVFGRAAAKRAAKYSDAGCCSGACQQGLGHDKALDRLDRMRHAKGDMQVGALRLDMQRAMQQYAAVFRSGASLDDGVRKMDQIASGMADIGIKVSDHIDLEYRSGGGSGAGKSDGPGAGHGSLSSSAYRIQRCARA